MSGGGPLRNSTVGLNYMLAHVMPPPCERGGRCPHYERCAQQQTACRDFFDYVEYDVHENKAVPASVLRARVKAGTAGSDRTPRQRFYKAVFRPERRLR